MSATRVLIACALFTVCIMAVTSAAQRTPYEVQNSNHRLYYAYPVQSQNAREKRFLPIAAAAVGLGAVGLGAAGLFGAGVATGVAGGLAHHAVASHYPYAYGGYRYSNGYYGWY